MHFNQLFSAKANFKMCIEAQKILVAIFSMPIPTIKYTIVLNDTPYTAMALLFMGRYFHEFHKKLAFHENIIVNSYARVTLL